MPVTYRVQIGRSADLASPIMDSSNVADTSLAAPPLQYFTIYFWRVRATNPTGTGAWSPVYRFRTVQVAGIAPGESAPTSYGLDQNYPNPFNPATTIGYRLPQAGKVTIVVYDVLGQEVTRLVDEVQAAGDYAVPWNAASRASGVYLVRMTAGAYVATKRMLLIK